MPILDQTFLLTSMDLTRDVIRDHLLNFRPEYVLFDFAYWIPDQTRDLGMKSVLYNGGYLASIANFLGQGKALGPNETRVMSAGANMDFGGVSLQERFKRALMGCDAIGSKTCREIEEHNCDIVEKCFGKPVVLAGPVILEPLASSLDLRFEEWLNGFGNGTVIYCALGSECALDKDQFQELLLGLELTGMPFLGALKPPNGYETIESALLEGFAERTKGRG